MNKLEISNHERLAVDTLLHYKFLTISQLSKLLQFEITPEIVEVMQDKLILKALKNRNFTTPEEPLYFALPNKHFDIDPQLYFQDIDLRKVSISQDDYFHIYHTVNYHILFSSYAKFRHITINYFSAYFDAFKNKTKKNELEMSGKFILDSGEYIIPNATMNFALPSKDEYIYVLDLFSDTDVQNIVKRINKYNQILIENKYKLDRVIFIFQDEKTKDEAIVAIKDSEILKENQEHFIFKTVQNLENDFSLQWMSFNSQEETNFLNYHVEKDVDDETIDIELEKEEESQEEEKVIIPKYTPPLKKAKKKKKKKNKKIKKTKVEKIHNDEEEQSQENRQEMPYTFSIFEERTRKKILTLLQDAALLIYTLAGVSAFVVSAYMEMIAFDSFYPGFFLISVVMVIAFEVAKVGSIFMKVYIKTTKSELNKITLKILSSIFIPLLFGLSIISSMAVTADKLESPHAEELKATSIKKIQTEYETIVGMTEKDHLRRTKQLKQDFFEKISEFEHRKKEVIADKDAEIEQQKTVYGSDGKTWKGPKYEEHIKERTNLITEFANERMRLEHLYNQQIEQESLQYRKEKKEDLMYKTENLVSAESEVLADSWQAQNEMVRSFIKVVNHGFHINLKELDFIFMLSILISILLELTIYKVFSNVAIVYAIRKKIS